MARVTGIGGVFLRARDPQALATWYAEHLGLPLTEYGGVNFVWTDQVPAGTGMTAWSTFPQDTDYFGPHSGPGRADGPQSTMINYRVDDLDDLLAQLATAGIQIVPHRDDSPYGRFAWIVDPEGNRLELWQPPALTPEPGGELLK